MWEIDVDEIRFRGIQSKKSMAETILLSFFFNARGTELEKSTTGLYRSLLVQLLESCPNLHQDLTFPGLAHGTFDDIISANRENLENMIT